jgi:hypothetical protein
MSPRTRSKKVWAGIWDQLLLARRARLKAGRSPEHIREIRAFVSPEGLRVIRKTMGDAADRLAGFQIYVASNLESDAVRFSDEEEGVV